MPLDFETMPILIGPRRRAILASLEDREGLAAAKLKRSKHKAGKAHATNQERSYADRQKSAKRKLLADARQKALELHRAAVRDYYEGRRDSHPGPFKG